MAPEREGLYRKERNNYAVPKADVLMGLGLASIERKPVVAACRDGEHSRSMGERPVALEDVAARESREE